MPRPICPTFAVPVGIPVYGLAFTSSNQLLLGGGGGAGRTGVKNKLISYKVEPRRKDIEEEAVYEVPDGEDAPMCLDIHPIEDVVVAGINSSEEAIKQDKNESCRLFKVLEAHFDLKKTMSTVDSQNVDDYQKVVRFSQDGSLFATGSSEGSVRLFKYNSLEPYCDPIRAAENDEVLDVDISLEKDKLVCVVKDALKLVNLRGRHMGEIMQTISPAKLDKKKRQLQLRGFRYGRMYTKDHGFAVLNGVGKTSGSFLCKVDAYTLETDSMIKISSKPVTAFCISREGGIVVAATADYSITIFDATTLRTLYTLKDAHGFSITCLAVSPDRKLLASGSADNTCRIVVLPTQFPGGAGVINPLYTVFFAILIAFAVLWLTTVFNYGTNEDTVLFMALRPSPAKGNSATTNAKTTNAATQTSIITSTNAVFPSITQQIQLHDSTSSNDNDNKDEL